MTLLAPLGLLGLLGIVALIIIYIIRPNYQQKYISSTYIWKLSLKYRKKRIPISKLRNILLILCQILILASCAAILAKPAIVLKTVVEETEIIAIIDSSASMRTEIDDETRFSRALTSAKGHADEVLNGGGIVSVILAEPKPVFLVERISTGEKTDLDKAFASLTNGEKKCSYGEANIEGAISLCEDVLTENPSAKIYLYSDTEYAYVPEGITIENVAAEEEWNAAILDVSTQINNNYYTFSVDVAYYGPDVTKAVTLTLQAVNANSTEDGGGQPMTLQHSFSFSGTQEKTIVFITDISYAELYGDLDIEEEEGLEYVILGDGERIYSYEAIYFNLDTTADSLALDNNFNLFNGQKQIVKIQYSSGNANPFFRGVLLTLQSAYAKYWDIQITEVKQGVEPAKEGFDFYLFEHVMPENLPLDGVVMLVNPDAAPDGAGFRVTEANKTFRDSISLTAESSHSILNQVNPDNITVSQYTTVRTDDTYETLMSCDGNPVFMVRNEPSSKVVLMTWSMHYSNLAILLDFPMLMCNVFDYFFPMTIADHSFDVYETFNLQSRGGDLEVKIGDTTLETLTTFPAKLSLEEPGNYILVQKNPLTNASIKEYVYVKVPASESNIFQEGMILSNPYKEQQESDYFKDLLLYLAAGLVALLFVEWWLQSRENM